MEFWQSLAVTEMDQLIAIARLAEELGFAGVTVSDHLVKPRRIRSHYPYSPDGRPFWRAEDPFPDPWVLIGAMARETTRIRFMPFVYVLPLRDPFSVAKAVSTAALLSKSRVGGHGSAALRRAARHDGWLGLRQAPAEIEGIVARLREEQRRVGREGHPLDVMVSHYPSTPDPGEYERYRDAGATSVNVPPWSYRDVDAPGLDDKRRSLEEFAERYIVPLGG